VSQEDVALTPDGMPGIILGSKRYPLCFTIAGMKRFAEHRGVTFETLMSEGWDIRSLSDVDIRTLLGIGMAGAEYRRSVFEGAEPRTIDPEVIDRIIELAHPGELLDLLVRVWNAPPAAKPDPPGTESSLPGA